MLRGAFLIATMLSVAVPVVANTNSVENTIEARLGYKHLIQHFSRELFAMARGDTGYDAENAEIFARSLNELTHLSNATLWPVGSDQDANPGKTRALANAVGSGAVQRHHATFRSATENLAGVAGNGLDALRGELGKLERVCRDCHESFRAHDF